MWGSCPTKAYLAGRGRFMSVRARARQENKKVLILSRPYLLRPPLTKAPLKPGRKRQVNEKEVNYGRGYGNCKEIRLRCRADTIVDWVHGNNNATCVLYKTRKGHLISVAKQLIPMTWLLNDEYSVSDKSIRNWTCLLYTIMLQTKSYDQILFKQTTWGQGP